MISRLTALFLLVGTSLAQTTDSRMDQVVQSYVGPAGADIYRVDFAKGSLEFRIRLAPDGKVEGASMSPAN